MVQKLIEVLSNLHPQSNRIVTFQFCDIHNHVYNPYSKYILDIQETKIQQHEWTIRHFDLEQNGTKEHKDGPMIEAHHHPPQSLRHQNLGVLLSTNKSKE